MSDMRTPELPSGRFRVRVGLVFTPRGLAWDHGADALLRAAYAAGRTVRDDGEAFDGLYRVYLVGPAAPAA